MTCLVPFLELIQPLRVFQEMEPTNLSLAGSLDFLPGDWIIIPTLKTETGIIMAIKRRPGHACSGHHHQETR